jgi:hypothetical protein
MVYVVQDCGKMASKEIPMCLQCARRFMSIRGLCKRCYTHCHKRVKSGETTWAELEAAGRALPALPQGKARRQGRRKTD